MALVGVELETLVFEPDAQTTRQIVSYGVVIIKAMKLISKSK